jgi:hypothetical protein
LARSGREHPFRFLLCRVDLRFAVSHHRLGDRSTAADSLSAGRVKRVSSELRGSHGMNELPSTEEERHAYRDREPSSRTVG